MQGYQCGSVDQDSVTVTPGPFSSPESGRKKCFNIFLNPPKASYLFFLNETSIMHLTGPGSGFRKMEKLLLLLPIKV